MALIENKVSSAVGVWDFEADRIINHPISSALTNVDKSIGSNNYNFEEEQLLGCDRIVTRQYEKIENENDKYMYRETIEFRTENIDNQYYYIEYYEYDMQPDRPNMDVEVENQTLKIDLHKIQIGISPLAQKYELYQVDKNKNCTLVSVREVSKYTTQDGKEQIIETIH